MWSSGSRLTDNNVKSNDLIRWIRLLTEDLGEFSNSTGILIAFNRRFGDERLTLVLKENAGLWKSCIILATNGVIYLHGSHS